MNFYEKIYLNIYLSLSRTNKSIPEWSTLFCLSSFCLFNLASLVIMLDIDIKGLNKIEIYAVMAIVFGIHYLYFQKGNRIIKKFTELKAKVNLASRLLTLIYCFGSISLFCFLAKVGWNNYLIIIAGPTIVVLIFHYMFGKRNKQFD